MKRRDFVKLSSGIAVATAAGIASPVPHLAENAVRCFKLDFQPAPDREILYQCMSSSPAAIVLEATMAPRLPELLVLAPVDDLQNTLRPVDDSLPVIDASMEYELRSYQLPPQHRSVVETGYTSGNHDEVFPTVSLLRSHGIRPLLGGIVDGRLVYLIAFESLPQRTRLWDTFTADADVPKGLAYEVRFYRRWHGL